MQLTVVLLAAREPFDDLGVSHRNGRARREQADRLDGRMVEGVRVGTAQPEDAAGRAVVVDRREHDRAGARRQAALHLRSFGRAQDGHAAAAQALDSERLVDRQGLVEERSVRARGDAEVRELAVDRRERRAVGAR